MWKTSLVQDFLASCGDPVWYKNFYIIVWKSCLVGQLSARVEILFGTGILDPTSTRCDHDGMAAYPPMKFEPTRSRLGPATPTARTVELVWAKRPDPADVRAELEAHRARR